MLLNMRHFYSFFRLSLSWMINTHITVINSTKWKMVVSLWKGKNSLIVYPRLVCDGVKQKGETCAKMRSYIYLWERGSCIACDRSSLYTHSLFLHTYQPIPFHHRHISKCTHFKHIFQNISLLFCALAVWIFQLFFPFQWNCMYTHIILS